MTTPLSEILEEILQYSSTETKENQRAGLSQGQLEEILKDFPFYVPREVRELYQWHDGTEIEEDNQPFNHTFIRLEEALKIRQECLEYNNESYVLYASELLPILTFDGEFYCTQCSNKKVDSAPISSIYHDDSVVYNSLTTMLLAFLECYKTGAYQSDGDIVDFQSVADIKLKWNPIRKDIYDDCKMRGELYYHP